MHLLNVVPPACLEDWKHLSSVRLMKCVWTGRGEVEAVINKGRWWRFFLSQQWLTDLTTLGDFRGHSLLKIALMRGLFAWENTWFCDNGSPSSLVPSFALTGAVQKSKIWSGKQWQASNIREGLSLFCQHPVHILWSFSGKNSMPFADGESCHNWIHGPGH